MCKSLYHLEAIKVRGQETRKERVSHDLVPHTTASVVVLLLLAAVVMILSIAHDNRYPSHLGTRIVVAVVAQRQRKELPISFHVHHVHRRRNTTATVTSKPYHSFKLKSRKTHILSLSLFLYKNKTL